MTGKQCAILYSIGDVAKLPGMASQVISEGFCYKWPSYIRGYHKYKSVSLPNVGEKLITPNPNPVGHVPKTVSWTVPYSSGSKSVGFCEVTG